MTVNVDGPCPTCRRPARLAIEVDAVRASAAAPGVDAATIAGTVRAVSHHTPSDCPRS